jgi:uroporphyrinogen decarboxylase
MLKTGSGEWIPVTLDVGGVPGFTSPILERFERETGSRQPEEYFDYDFRTVSLKTRFGGDDPAALHETVPAGTTYDEWGIGHWAGGAAGTYEKTFPPLAAAQRVADVERFPVPAIESETPYPTVHDYHARGYPIFGYAGSIYEWSWWLRGMELFMMDLLSNVSMAESVIGKVATYTKTLALESAAAGIDVLCFYDDAGMQTGMQIDPDLWRCFIKPRWREILEAVRATYPSTAFFLHSCGNIEAIIPDVIEVGFDILHPIQPECMDFQSIHERYGRDITLCATISAQQLFPFGTPDEIRRWTRRVRQLCSPDNRAILCPSNMIQPETPWENILAFAEAARERE